MLKIRIFSENDSQVYAQIQILPLFEVAGTMLAIEKEVKGISCFAKLWKIHRSCMENTFSAVCPFFAGIFSVRYTSDRNACYNDKKCTCLHN